MAWVTRSERFSWERPKSRENPQDSVGPGAYPLPTSFKVAEDIRPAYAPFNSTKDLDEVQGLKDPHDVKKVPDFGLDPGCYNPKFPKGYDHGLPKKHVPFSCGAPRSSRLNKDSRPGPGDYSVATRSLSISSCKTMGKPQAEQKVMFKSTSAPSIPRDSQCFGYDEAGDGRLVRQGRKDGILQLSGTPGDSAGPGQYNLQNALGVGGRSAFGKINPPPAEKPSRVTDTPGPGHYVVKGMTEGEKPIYSAFASQTERGTKYEKNAAETPGPGQYYGPRPMRPSLREQHPELQYFGSTSERFKEFGTSSTGKIGPGQYGVPGVRRKAPQKSGWSQGGRFEESALLQKRAATLPGPGAYDPAGTDGKTTGPTGTVSILGSTGSLAFGSMQARRGEGYIRKGEEGPGPGAYYDGIEEAPELSRSSEANTKKPVRRKWKTPSSMFSSSVPKDAMTRQYERDGQVGPPPGAYSPQAAQDVGSVLRMPPRNEGFGSAAPRDKDVKSFTAPGPGWYKPGDITGGKTCGTFNRTAVEGVPASGKPKGLGFESGTKRFQSKSDSKNFPGPGSYKTDPSWIKTTHNIHFGDFG
eukprot:gb/GFBE01050004.1/.p1 GENE.gb/GFBE01050004.1/~~gb/GFBE01050004.1/.p1  ORF type:complete len:582 (+),score=78.86 gb/GFBE01050004.1/:1-1746(+)